MEFELNEWLLYAKKVAKSFAYQFQGIDEDDIFQEMAILLYTKEEQLKATARTDSYVKKCLQNISWNYCMKERGSTIFYTDQYDYRPESVRLLLEQYYAGSAGKVTVPEEMKTVHKDDDLAVYGDISRVVDELSETHQEALENKYMMGIDPETAAERKALSRAVSRVTQVLNENKKTATREYEGTGSRKAVSNAAAMYMTKEAPAT
ncbi:hypothetical protein OHA74_20850 [Streptomyces phaeochromogenes]|uniref:hypothetical protein n=1 Tax=Streptomyces phaeochromogenes TaxID=1923 RepID=UPI002E27F4B8|nr:hypothetical protein [Streptomyces phaeochromogenes]